MTIGDIQFYSKIFLLHLLNKSTLGFFETNALFTYFQNAKRSLDVVCIEKLSSQSVYINWLLDKYTFFRSVLRVQKSPKNVCVSFRKLLTTSQIFFPWTIPLIVQISMFLGLNQTLETKRTARGNWNKREMHFSRVP